MCQQDCYYLFPDAKSGEKNGIGALENWRIASVSVAAVGVSLWSFSEKPILMIQLARRSKSLKKQFVNFCMAAVRTLLLIPT